MYIQNQLCGMAIMGMLLYMFLRQRRIGLYSEHVFLRTLVVTMISVGLDMLSLVAIASRDMLPGFVLDLICKSYVVSLIFVGCLAYMYIILDLYRERVYKKHLKRSLCVTVIEAVIVYALPIQYHVDTDGVYTEGPSIFMTYMFALSFVLAAVGVVVLFGKRLERKRRLASLTWMGMWIGTSTVQFFNNELLLVGFGSSLGMLALYCILENPENNIDRTFGCFRKHAMTNYLSQCYERGESRSIVFLSFVSRQYGNPDMEGYVDQCMRELIDWLRVNTQALIFHNVENELAIVFSDMSEMSLVFSDIQETFYYHQFYNIERTQSDESANYFPETLFVLFPDTLLARDVEEVLSVHKSLCVENYNLTNSLVCYVNDHVIDRFRKKNQMVQEIINALNDDRVEVFFQPIYSVREKRFVSAEALARIRNTDGSILPPGAFIPVAEESGLILRLGERVFEKVCLFLNHHDPGELGIAYIEVNLSVLQCEQHNLAVRYMEIMNAYGTNPELINLELTETGTLKTNHTLLRNMNQLIEKGVTFSLDDFGNNRSNLDYMIDLPVSVMKLDMNMTQAYFRDEKARVVVQSVIRLAHQLHLSVVAEGVETKEQFEGMVALEVDYIQGYYFSKPVPADEYLTFMQHGIHCNI